MNNNDLLPLKNENKTLFGIIHWPVSQLQAWYYFEEKNSFLCTQVKQTNLQSFSLIC